MKAKKIEDISVILNRIERANCCLKPQNPEDIDTLTKAVGDGSEYIAKPYQKAFRVRHKLLNNAFLQNVTEDFMSKQNLDRNIEETIVTSDACFK